MTPLKITLVALAVCALGGCTAPQMLTVAPLPAAPPDLGDARYLRNTTVKSEGPSESSSAVDSALAWSDKYSQAVEKVAGLQQENQNIQSSQTKLQAENARLQAELAQCQKELKDATSLLVEMRSDLDDWKANVLGYRDEMRKAQQTQLDATAKVLKLLGGEAAKDTPSTQPAENSLAQKDDRFVR